MADGDITMEKLEMAMKLARAPAKNVRDAQFMPSPQEMLRMWRAYQLNPFRNWKIETEIKETRNE